MVCFKGEKLCEKMILRLLIVFIFTSCMYFNYLCSKFNYYRKCQYKLAPKLSNFHQNKICSNLNTLHFSKPISNKLVVTKLVGVLYYDLRLFGNRCVSGSKICGFLLFDTSASVVETTNIINSNIAHEVNSEQIFYSQPQF